MAPPFASFQYRSSAQARALHGYLKIEYVSVCPLNTSPLHLPGHTDLPPLSRSTLLLRPRRQADFPQTSNYERRALDFLLSCQSALHPSALRQPATWHTSTDRASHQNAQLRIAFQSDQSPSGSHPQSIMLRAHHRSAARLGYIPGWQDTRRPLLALLPKSLQQFQWSPHFQVFQYY